VTSPSHAGIGDRVVTKPVPVQSLLSQAHNFLSLGHSISKSPPNCGPIVGSPVALTPLWSQSSSLGASILLCGHSVAQTCPSPPPHPSMVPQYPQPKLRLLTTACVTWQLIPHQCFAASSAS
jgi:hypothetical protein